MITALIDSNVLISSIFWNGSPRKVIDAAIALKFSALTTEYILREIETVLLRKPFSLPPIRIQQVFRDILSYTTLVQKKTRKRIKIRDKADEAILQVAIGSSAQYLVTGDKDLLVLDNIDKVQIVTPASFLKFI